MWHNFVLLVWHLFSFLFLVLSLHVICLMEIAKMCWNWKQTKLLKKQWPHIKNKTTTTKQINPSALPPKPANFMARGSWWVNLEPELILSCKDDKFPHWVLSAITASLMSHHKHPCCSFCTVNAFLYWLLFFFPHPLGQVWQWGRTQLKSSFDTCGFMFGNTCLVHRLPGISGVSKPNIIEYLKLENV